MTGPDFGSAFQNDEDRLVTTPQDQNSELLNIKEAAAVLKVSEASLRRWTNSGQLPCLRLGAKGERRFRREDLMSFLEHRKMETASPELASRPAEVLVEGIAIEYGNHICTLYENDLGRLKWSVPFLIDGLRNGDGCFLVGTPETRKEILGHVRKGWDDVDQALERGQLVETDGLNNGEEMCRFIERSLFMMKRSGLRAFRLLGDMSWCQHLGMTHDELLAYEMRYNHEIAPRYPLVSVCQYDVRDFSGPGVLSALKCHDDTFKYSLSRFLAS